MRARGAQTGGETLGGMDWGEVGLRLGLGHVIDRSRASTKTAMGLWGEAIRGEAV